ncbi:substrate-binding domain-containing protein [uncultured Ruminococcus sp.]|uniref:substrate-binding domain-containing protein n=1 Tax=uncultured Ruminococcus sp. TaxID=165186 RepID=UPI0025DE5BF4|nr:substrate-binding domain-containing protein [uncultured Ruminococcus sp.]
MSRRLLIGVIIADCHIDFQCEILRGIITQAFKSSCDIAVIAPLHDFSVHSVHKDAEKSVFDLILSDSIDGLIYDRNTFHDEDICRYIDNICKRSEKPVMLLDHNGHNSFETTSVDDREAFEIITDHLINVHGYKKIYCLTGPKNTFSGEERLAGYKSSMKKHGIDIGRNWCEYGDFWTEAPKKYAKRILSGELERPEAVVCGNDVMAITLTKLFTDAGIRVPEDIAVTGYDASIEGYQSTPSITSYSRPNFQLGAESVRRLYRIITGKICSRVPNENGELRLGESCGCAENPGLRHNIQRNISINSRFESQLLYGDMLFDITNADNIATFADRLDNYTYFLHKMRRVRICLTRSYIDSTVDKNAEELSFRAGDDMKVVLAKSAIWRESENRGFFSSSDLLPDYSEERSYPSAFFISPLHYNNNFFGYCAVSFGKEPRSFSSLYIKWINYVNVALEQVRIKAVTKRTVLNTSRALLYDHITGLLNRSGIEQEFATKLSAGAGNSFIECAAFELHGLKKAYYQSGEEKSNSIMAAFAKNLRSCIRGKEICGAWASQTLCVISPESGRAEAIYNELCGKIKETQFSGDENCNIDFSVGVCGLEITPSADLSDAMYKATVNRVFTYTISEPTSNPQFEKLCLLRNRIKKNPELPWSISEIAESLYLSKSYLQKIYKSYFGRSIIEEMIQFRIENAKTLLSQTDMTVTEISRECGYSSYNYFVRQFRSSEGCSPSDYRDEQKRKAEENEG